MTNKREGVLTEICTFRVLGEWEKLNTTVSFRGKGSEFAVQERGFEVQGSEVFYRTQARSVMLLKMDGLKVRCLVPQPS